jgi:hypothetical protein
MPTAISLLLSTLLLTSSTHSRVVPPQLPYPLSRRAIDTSSSCTFSLFHKQVHAVNYIQVNTLVDHTNDIIIDLAHLRPPTEHNSYAKVSKKRVFAVEGLLGNTNLTIRGEDGSDRVRFESDGLRWSTEGGKEGSAWCEVGEWDGEKGRPRVSQTRC